MLKVLVASASFVIAIGAFTGLGYIAHDGAAAPYQSLEFSGY